MKRWSDSSGSLVTLAELDGDRLVLLPTSEFQVVLRALWIPCVFERAPGAPVEASKSMRVSLGRWHWPTVRSVLPVDLVAHVEQERPAWLAWVAREEGFRARRPADPLAEVERVQGVLFGGQTGDAVDAVGADHPWHRLYPYQQVGVRWAREAGERGIIGDSMGLGKSSQSSMVIERSHDARRALVVCPGSLPVNWQREMKTWAPSWTTSIAWSARDIQKLAAGAYRDRHATIVSWGLLSRPAAAEALRRVGYDAVIIDECHYAKGMDAARTHAVIDLAHEASIRLLLSGTPIKSRPAEFWTLMHMIDPIRFHSFFPWGETFCGARDQFIGTRVVRTYKGSARLPQLAKVTTPYLLRREKEDVLKDLPPKRRQVLPVAGPAALVAETEDLKQEIRDQALSGSAGGAALGKIGPLRKKIGLAKVPAAVEWAVQAHRDGEPTVLFIYHHEVAEALRVGLEAEGLRVGVITGETPVRARQAIVDAFQGGDLDALIGSEAIKEGISLVRSAFSCQVEWWWTPGDHDQAEDRLCRNKQLRSVLNVYLLLLGTFDVYVADLVDEKRGVVSGALNRDLFYKALLRRLEAA